MTRFFTCAFTALVLFTCAVSAQTPQQLKMLKNRGDVVVDRTSGAVSPSKGKYVYFDEEKGRFVIPVNTNPKTIEMKNGMKVAAPMAKTEQELMESLFGPDLDMLDQMSPDEAKAYAEYLAQDRIFLSTSDFRVTNTVSGMKYCQMKLNIKNNTPRRLKRIYITYSWGDVKTSVTFSNLDVADAKQHEMALAGSVCDVITNGAEYTISTCSMEGLTEEQCRMRVTEL
ncbi:MAG: hypothetical protein J6Y03_04895 [Alphaproteobacteria bacterium]|nr:hypothetical protein [Alphaproteobacteria bacterium]